MASLEDIMRLEDWDTYEGHATEDEKPLLAPSLNIKDDLKAAISGDFNFTGAFAHSNSYVNAPNPCMDLERIGLLGLPLNEIQLKAIITTFPDVVEGEGIWTIPGDKIRFQNPAWDTWIKNTVVTSLNTALRASVANTVLKTRLKSLVIRSKHAESTSYYHDIHEDSRSYAFLSIILPSPHSGGQLQLRPKEATKTFSTSEAALMTSIAVGAYDSVSQIVTPVESGYLVYLSYELSILGETHALPRLPQLDSASVRLQKVFRSWRQALDTTSAPSLLFLKLNHKYKVKSLKFKATSLEGSDRLQLSYIAPLAKAYGFNLYLARARYLECGPVTIGSSGSGGRGYGGYGWCDYDEDDEWSDVDEDDLEMDEVDGKIFTLKPVKALDGTPMRCIHPDLDEDSEDPTCDHLFINGPLTDGKIATDFSRSDRDSGTLTYTWEASVLVINPAERAGQDFKAGDTHCLFARSVLSTSLSEAPTRKEKRSAKVLLTWIRRRKSQDVTALQNAATILRNSADRWNNADLFIRTCQACGPDRCIALIGVDGMVSAYQAFDWKGIQVLYTNALAVEPSNQTRAKVLEGILTTATGQGDADVISWCNIQRMLIVDTLQKLDTSEVDWVVDVIQSKPNPTLFLRDVFLPRTAGPFQDASSYYGTLCSHMVAFMQEKPAIRSRLTTFFAQVVDVLLPAITTSNVQIFRIALQNTTNPMSTLKCLTPERIKEMAQRPASLKCFSECVATTLRPMAKSEDSKAALGRILAACLQAILVNFDLRSLEATSLYQDGQTLSGVELLKLCFTLGLSTPFAASSEIVEPYKKSLTEAPFSTFASEVVKKFVRHILGAKPNAAMEVQELRNVGCGCTECNRFLLPFFLTGCGVQINVRDVVRVRSHLEAQLSGRARGWGVTWTTLRIGSPHTLQIVKPGHMRAIGVWAGNQKAAATVMALLGDVQQQKTILGADYKWVAGTIAGTAVPPSLAAAKRQSDATTQQTTKKRRTA